MRLAARRSLWAWLKHLLGLTPVAARARAATAPSEQEARAFAEFSRHYGITFHNPELLKLALTHRSYLSVTGQGPRESNERLEFLGDSVLGLVTSEFLYREHPTEHEGQLTKTKSLLVSKAILSRRALAMGLGRFVLMSHSEIESGGRQRLSIVADAFESVLGAIYLDQGFEAARSFIHRWLLKDSREIAADERHTNYKSHLQEYVQSNFHTHPVYRIRSQMGPDHSKQFMVEVTVGRRTLGSGRGRNKKEAEQAAARDALEKLELPASTLRDRDLGVATEAEVLTGAPTAPEIPERELEDESEEEFDRPRRRRGRRGGRGRRVREPEEPKRPAAVEEPEVEAARIEAPVAEPPRRARPRPTERHIPIEVDTEPELPRKMELEPLPPAYEEDENEEVGRPDWPLEERLVDPYSVEPEPAEEESPEPATAAYEDAAPEAPFEADAETRSSPGPEREADREPWGRHAAEDEHAAPEEESEVREPAGGHGARPGAAAAPEVAPELREIRYGRRGSRGKRGPR